MMKFTLAVLAGSAHAIFNNQPSIPQGFYGSSQQSHYKPSYYPSGPTSPHAPKPPAPTYSHFGHQDSHSSQHSHHAPAPSHAPHDPWNPSGGHSHGGHGHYTPSKPDGWWSATQQYSPPKIKFIPDASKPSFAICKINNANLQGDIQIAQLPWRPSQLTASLVDTSATAIDSDIYFRINELGRLMSTDTDMCMASATGDEFNPLAEKDYYGRPNPYQDPSRGRIEPCTVEGAVDSTGAPILDGSGDQVELCELGKAAGDDGQKYLLQNYDDLIGRSITAYALTGSLNAPVETPLGCCTIGIDETPDYYKPKPKPQHHDPWNPHQGGHYYGGHSGHHGH